MVLCFVLLYIPSFMRDTAQGASNAAVVADVDGHEITVAQFRRVYEQQMRAYRQSYGANVDEKLLKQLGIDQRIVQQMIEEEAASAEASRLGITASDAEVRERILALPAFQENGQFIGDERYRQILRMQMPPMRPDEFENQLRRDITVEKLQAAVTGWITVNEDDVAQEYKRRNEKVKLAVVSFPADKFRDAATASDADVAKYFDEHKELYRVPEKRKIRFLTIDQEAMRAKAVVTGQQIERSYNDNIQQYSTPEQVRASHILLKTEGKDDAVVKKQAEEILAKARAGSDFAELAKKYSEDEDSAKKGGDLDFFGKGRMVPQFEQKAFSMQPGEISDLVKTQFGYHIIKLVDKKPAETKAARRSAIPDRGSAEVGRGPGAGPEARGSNRGRAEVAERLRQGRCRARAPDVRVRVLQAGRADCGHRPGAQRGPAGVHHEGGGRQRADSHAAGVRVHHGARQAGPVSAKAR